MDINERIKGRPDLKLYFVKNAIPTESNFADLIDSVPNQREDGFVKTSGEPLSIEAGGGASSQKRAVNFYWDFADDKPHWVLSLNPRATPSSPATAKPGFSISDAEGRSRLFIDRHGNLGVSTVSPAAKLDILGGEGDLSRSEGDLRVGNAQFRFKVGVAVTGPGRGDVRLRAQGGTNRLILGSDTTDTLTVREGNVGIRELNPKLPLDVNGGLGVKGEVVATGGVRAGALGIGPWPRNPTEYVYFGTTALNQSQRVNYALLQDSRAANLGRTYLNSPLDIRFRIKNVDKMVISSTGRIGIGTDSPTAALDVKGTVKGQSIVASSVQTEILSAGVINTTLHQSTGRRAQALKSTNQWFDFPDMAREITLKATSTVLIYYQATMKAGGAAGSKHIVTQLVIGRSTKRDAMSISGNTEYWAPSSLWIGKLPKGTHTIKVQYRTPGGGTNKPASVGWHSRVLKVLVLGN